MPWYEYTCEANGKTLEAMHAMDRTIKTWGELAEAAGEDPGDAPAQTPVQKVFTASLSIADGSAKGPSIDDLPPGSCGSGCACHPA